MIIKLSTGKEFYANHGLISVGKNGEWYLCEGYDGDIRLIETDDNGKDIPIFTKLELAEIVAGQLLLWNSFLQDIENGKVPTLD